MIDPKKKKAVGVAPPSAFDTAIHNRESSITSVNLVCAVFVSNIVALLVWLLAWAGYL